jgi:hypothetical protein
MPRPAPRWAKWSRGVRTRGLRVGLVGGPRPLYFLGPRFFKSRRSLPPTVPDNIAPLDFPKKWHNIRHDDEHELGRLRIKEATGHPLGGRFATVAALPRARCGIFRAAMNGWVCCRDEKWPH